MIKTAIQTFLAKLFGFNFFSETNLELEGEISLSILSKTANDLFNSVRLVNSLTRLWLR